MTLAAIGGGTTGGGIGGGTSGCPGGVCEVTNPLSAKNFPDLIKSILNAALIIGVPIIVLFLVYAGFMFIIARGNTTKLEDARRNLLWVVVGAGVFLGAWTIAQIIANTLAQFGVKTT